MDAEFWSRFDSLEVLSDPVHQTTGLSTSKVWKVDTNRGPLAVKRYSESLGVARVSTIHLMQRQAIVNGLDFIPQPISDRDGESAILDRHGKIWELQTWRPGQPATGPISDAKLIAGCQAIARWHVETQFDRLPEAVRWSFCPAQLTSISTPRSFESRQMGWNVYAKRLASLEVRARDDPDGLAPVSKAVLTRAADLFPSWLVDCRAAVRLCLIHGDPRREHLLFEGDRVSGLIDFGAVRWDAPAVDLARWLGEVAPPDRWQTGLEAYRRVIPLEPAAERSILAFFRTGLAIAVLRWATWFRDNLIHPDHKAQAYARWREVLTRLETNMREADS